MLSLGNVNIECALTSVKCISKFVMILGRCNFRVVTLDDKCCLLYDATAIDNLIFWIALKLFLSLRDDTSSLVYEMGSICYKSTVQVYISPQLRLHPPIHKSPAPSSIALVV